jgi:hypothetical protein
VSLQYKVVNVENTKESSDYIYIGRSRLYGGPTKWGNPYRIGQDGTRDEVIASIKSGYYQILNSSMKTFHSQKGIKKSDSSIKD